MEDLIAGYPHEFIEEGLTLIERQSVYGGPRIDLLFRDKFNRLLLVELKKGTLTREHVGQVHEYYGAIKNKKPGENLELMIIANNIPSERKRFLEEIGVNFKEISEERFLKVAEKYGKAIEFPENALGRQSIQPSSPSKIGNKIMSSDIGILFCSKGEEHTRVGVEHLKTNKELYFSVGYPIKAEKFSYPLTGLIHISGPEGSEVRYKCRIKDIRPYSPSDHTDMSKKPDIWIIKQRNAPRGFRTTMIIDAMESYTYETTQLRNLQGDTIKGPPQGYRPILLP